MKTIPQRELLSLMRILIDTASKRVGSRSRDEARILLRQVLDTQHWQTAHVQRNLRAKRMRFVSGMGYKVDPKYLITPIEDLERLHAYDKGRR